MPEKLYPENAASNYRYGWKIPASNCRYSWKIQASNYRSGWKITTSTYRYWPQRPFIQGSIGTLVEYQAVIMKVKGLRPAACAQMYTTGKFWWRGKLRRKFRHKWKTLCFLYVRIQSAAPGLGSGI
jgi:hypothetical protein